MLWHTSRAYLLWQILIVFINSLLLWTALHVKLEPSAHFSIFGSISLLRLKVFSTPTPSTLCSFLSIVAMFRGWLPCRHFTLRPSGKKPLRVQTSLTFEAPSSPSQTGFNVMFGETACRAEIENSVIYLPHSKCYMWTFLKINMSWFHLFGYTYLQISSQVTNCAVSILSVMSLYLGQMAELYFYSVWWSQVEIGLEVCCTDVAAWQGAVIRASSKRKHWVTPRSQKSTEIQKWNSAKSNGASQTPGVRWGLCQ